MCRPLLIHVYDSNEWYLKLIELNFKTWNLGCTQVFNNKCLLIDSLAYHSPDILIMEVLDENLLLDDMVEIIQSINTNIKLIFLGNNVKKYKKLSGVHVVEKDDCTFRILKSIISRYNSAMVKGVI